MPAALSKPVAIHDLLRNKRILEDARERMRRSVPPGPPSVPPLRGAAVGSLAGETYLDWLHCSTEKIDCSVNPYANPACEAERDQYRSCFRD
ncbi:MAG: hypothetical protein R3B70_24630 [Polyangiaceae bacterium]